MTLRTAIQCRLANKQLIGLVRFVPKSDPYSILIGEPSQEDLDIGLATRDGKDVAVNVFSGQSVLSLGSRTDRTESVERILSPLAQQEVGAIRCIGLNASAPVSDIKIFLY